MERKNYLVPSVFDKMDSCLIPYSKEPKFISDLNEISLTMMKGRDALKLDNRKEKNLLKKAVNFCVSSENDSKNIELLEEIVLPKARVLGKMVDNKLHGYCEISYADGSVFKYTEFSI